MVRPADETAIVRGEPACVPAQSCRAPYTLALSAKRLVLRPHPSLSAEALARLARRVADVLSSAHTAALCATPLHGLVTSIGSPLAVPLFGDAVAAATNMFIVVAAETPRRQLGPGDLIRVHAETTVVFEAQARVSPSAKHADARTHGCMRMRAVERAAAGAGVAGAGRPANAGPHGGRSPVRARGCCRGSWLLYAYRAARRVLERIRTAVVKQKVFNAAQVRSHAGGPGRS